MLGVLIMNTGTPDSPTPDAIRPYLKQFLSDRNLIDMPPVLWQPILNLFILPNRPKRTAPFYQEIWTPEGSPFLLHSQSLCKTLEKRLGEFADEGTLAAEDGVRVALGMRYGNPSAEAGLRELRDAGVDTIVCLPLYPQKTRACAGTCFQEFNRAFEKVFGVRPDAADATAKVASSDAAVCEIPSVPRVMRIDHYWDAPGYISALADSVRRSWEYTPSSKLVMSFHSVPMSHISAGDPYAEQTLGTLQALIDELDIPRGDTRLTYQSRFDKRTWLGPMIEPTLLRLAREQVKNVAVICPGFSVDNLESIHEVGIQMAQRFKEECERCGNKGARFTYIPALEDDPALIEVLARLIATKLAA